jgi:transposase-like protein
MSMPCKPPAERLTHPERAARRAAVAAAVRAGKGIEQTARHFGVSPTTVMACCKEFGVTPSHCPHRSAPTTLAIIAALQLGGRKSDVARQFNVSRQRIQQISNKAREAGIVLPGGKGPAAQAEPEAMPC